MINHAQSNNKIKCVIFDCDRTLVDSEHLFNRALSDQLRQRGISLDAQVLVKRFRGVRLSMVLESLEAEYSVSLDGEFVAVYRDAVEALFRRELVACKGVVETLASLRVAMCVASNGPIAKMKLALSVTGLSNFFGDRLFSAYQVNAWKPDPELFHHAAKEMGFDSTQCLVVEDSLVGIEAARKAGMTAVLYDPNKAHKDVNGLIKIDCFSQLRRYVPSI